MATTDFHITALVRKAIRLEDAAAGMKIFRAKSCMRIDAQTAGYIINEVNNGYTTSDFIQSVACIRSVLPFFTNKGMILELPGIGILSPVIKGKAMPGDFNLENNIKLSYSLRLDKSFEKEIIKGMKCDFVQMTPARPTPTLLEPAYLEDEKRTDFYPNQGVRLRGTRLKYNEDNPAEGIFLEAANCATVRIEHVTVKAKEVLFQLPTTLVPGKKYKLTVRAKLYKCRDVREGSLLENVIIGTE